ELVRYEETLHAADGRICIIDFTLKPVKDETGRVVLLIPEGHDITERKQAEDALQESEQRIMDVFYSSSDAILLLDGDKFVECNEATVRMLGYATRQELLMTHPSELSPPVQPDGRKSFEKANEMIRIIFANGYHRFEWMHRKASGEDFPVEVSATRIMMHGQDMLYIVWYDITARKLLEEALLQAKKLETMGTFSAGIAHDFNNLLTGVLGYITLAMDYSNKPPRAMEFLGEAEKIIFKAKDLTSNFLMLSGAGIEYKNTAEPCKLIKEAAELKLKGSNVHCEFTLSEERCEVLLAATLLHRIISNVVENAKEAMPDGGGLNIKAEYIAYNEVEKTLPLKEGRYLCVNISDTGLGISCENLSRIFDPYYSTKQRGVQKGMGLGLAVAQSIITRLNGYIKVESREGRGTDVFIYLPAAARPPGSDEKKEEPEAGKIASAAGSKKILFMDDEEALRITVNLLLKQVGYDVDAAANGEEALQKYVQARDAGSPFDAVILDLSVVGGMGGVETIKKLLEVDPQVKGIIFSGYAADPVMDNYEKYGFKGSLVKPAARAQIVEALKKIC
ncbi:MAG: ATP-binding protein, partial [Pseudomonadota bacterium]